MTAPGTIGSQVENARMEIPCVVYAAKSTEDPRGSIGTQLTDAQAALKREGDRSVAAEYQDEAASAFHGDRGPGLAAAKAHATRLAREHGSCELWVQHSDRLARGDGLSAAHLAEVFFELRRVGVQIRSVQDDGTFSNPMLVAAIGERNREDSSRKSAATRAGKRRRWESGKVVGGPVHDGYKLDPVPGPDGKPQVERDGRVVYQRVRDPDRAPIIERIFDLVEAGHTFGDVARTFNREGLRTVRNAAWTTRRIRETVHNPYYAGMMSAYGEHAPGSHEPLIDPDRWQRIIDGLKRLDPVAAQRRKGGRRPVEEYLLRRIGFCGQCGLPLYTRRGAKGRRLYVCRARRTCEGTCMAPEIPADIAEAQVLARLETFVGDVEQWISEQAEAADGERQQFITAVERQRAEVVKVERRLERAQAQYERLLDEDPDLADHALAAVGRIQTDLRQRAHAILQAEQRLTEWDMPDVDMALDYYVTLRQAISGRLSNAQSIKDLNTTLRTVLEGVWLSIEHDPELGDVLLARFVAASTAADQPAPAISLASIIGHWRHLLDEQQEIQPALQDPHIDTRLSADLTADQAARVFPDAMPSRTVRKNTPARGPELPPLRVPLTDAANPPSKETR